MPQLAKGDRVQVELYPADLVSLSGFQMKVEVQKISVIGTCIHLRGDHPTEPTDIRIYIDVTEGVLPENVKLVKPYGCEHDKGHLEVRQEWVKGVEKNGKTYRMGF